MDGIINVLKPIGMTSTDVVRWVLRNTPAQKAGHIGTLDPGAAGVLPICVGKATRLAEYHSVQGKTYRAEITLGITTDTQDAFGEEISRVIPGVIKEDFADILTKFTGHINQIPPMYSAVKRNGKPLYAYARQGLEIVRENREVEISKIQLLEWHQEIFPRALLDIECSKGTYIRTLCHDIGQELGCGAHLSFLLRLRAGHFTLDASHTLEEIAHYLSEQADDFILKPEWGLDLPVMSISPSRLNAFRNGLATGRSLVGGNILQENDPVKVVCEGQFIGIGTWRDDCLYPNKVLN